MSMKWHFDGGTERHENSRTIHLVMEPDSIPGNRGLTLRLLQSDLSNA